MCIQKYLVIFGAFFDEIYFVLCNLRPDRNVSDFLVVKNPIANFVNFEKRKSWNEACVCDSNDHFRTEKTNLTC